ncbi:hypothetical protein BLNAU_23815 [Blattamonas nauphoetae]|uniref:CUB domain-containing protein n=1 Tax=Blattamonas nauphoetae TaxID=2049346 RepID=A0ABQ9WP72_9EUKA|nr:hypothetical protein BLNAU_23815 [Blattamonas nauphoetae]
MASVQFIGNSAPNGSDVYLSAGCGTPSEVKERVSDCHTDKPDTSVKFEDFGVQTGIIDEFGTTTIITSLQLAMSPTASEGTIEVETQHPVQGTMILLLGSSDACSPLSDGSPHATCRVVVVSFPTLSTTGTSDVLSFGENENLQSQCTYSLIAASISATVIDVASPSSFFAGDPARVRRFNSEQGANIGEVLVSLEGRKLAAGEYTVSFEGNTSFSLVFSFADWENGLPTQISSSVSVGPGGTDKRFSFGETYKVGTITFNNNRVMMEAVGFSLAIPPFPTPFVFNVNKQKGGEENCRRLDRSCASFDSAFETASKMGMKSIELKLSISETFSKTLSISDENELSVTQKDVSPSLIVPSHSHVDALIHCSSLDLKLVRVSSGFFVFAKSSITYTPSSSTNTNTRISNSDLCSWTTGVIELVNSTSDISFCSFTNLKQGAIVQRGGFLYLHSVFFQSDGPINDDFPSARRNVMCSEDGVLMIGGLKGDGRSHLFPGSGLSTEACYGSKVIPTIPIPFLDTSRSRVTRDRKTGNCKMKLVGSGFVPCGLKVEVQALLDDGRSEESATLAVDTSTALSFTETEIVFVITPAHVANLSKKSDWKVRLLNDDPACVSSWILLRRAPTSKLRLIHVVTVVVVVLAGMVLALLVIRKCHSKKPAEKTKEKIDTPNGTHPTIITQAASDQSEHESAAEQAVQNKMHATRLFSKDSEVDDWIRNRSAAPFVVD